MSAHTFMRSRSGATFGATVSTEPDGALTIVSNYGDGYRSAHRDYARAYFGAPIMCMTRLRYRDDAPMVLTRWQAVSDY